MLRAHHAGTRLTVDRVPSVINEINYFSCFFRACGIAMESSTSDPGGNKVDGLPPAPSAGFGLQQ